jgi:hypothetical protein
MISLELETAYHDLANALQVVRLRLDHVLLLAKSDTTNDERIKLLTSSASALATMLESIEIATRPDAAGKVKDGT